MFIHVIHGHFDDIVGFLSKTKQIKRFPMWLSGKESTCRCRRPGFNPWVGKISWRREWQPPPGFLPGKPRGQKSLVSYSPRGCIKLDMAEPLTLSFFLKNYQDSPLCSSSSAPLFPPSSLLLFAHQRILWFRKAYSEGELSKFKKKKNQLNIHT